MEYWVNVHVTRKPETNSCRIDDFADKIRPWCFSGMWQVDSQTACPGRKRELG